MSKSIAEFGCRIRAGFTVAIGVTLSACASMPATGSREIDNERLIKHVRALASDEMEGRGAGYPGERRAAEYIARQFAEAGLAPGFDDYFQRFTWRPVGGVEAFQSLQSRNVVGVLRGASRAQEVIVLGAHYDGQGMVGEVAEGRLGEARAGDDKIWNSASDNATSVAALIEIARTLNQGARPARTIVFVAFSAEENRLNGAFEYVRHPALPWKQHVAMINLEKLVGHEDTKFITATQGSSPRFDAIAEMAQKDTNVAAANFYAGLVSDTDHFAFNLAGLPALVIGTGAYERVHRNDDHADTLRLEEFGPRARYILAFVSRLANDAEPLPFVADLAGYSGIVGGPATEAELRLCGLDTPAFVVTDIAPRSLAASSRLRVNDVVTRANDVPMKFGEDGANFLEDATSSRGDVVVEISCAKQVRREHVTLTPAAASTDTESR